MTDVRARTRPGAWSSLRILLCGLSVALTALFASSCGNQTFVAGTPVITLTAQPGRFTSYIVNIPYIQMTRTDGTLVQLPTFNERIDLAHLSSYANLLEAPAISIGTYVSATFVLDYSSAYITVGNNGQASPVKTLLDASTGKTPRTTTVTVKFDPNNPLVITHQTSSVVAFDIDLEASNSIVMTPEVQVTVQPFWNVTTQPAYNKPVYARGLYVYTNTKDNYFVMNVRPLHDIFYRSFGALQVNVTDQTYYNIGGVTYVGASGLAAIQSLQSLYANLQIAAYGPNTGNPFADLSGVTPTFNATAVYVGSSLESLDEDQITGIVSGISDNGNTLNVMGAALVTRQGIYGFQQAIPVTIGPNTVISQDGVATFTPSPSAISVGQVITVNGLATLDASGNPTALDATGNSVPGAQLRLQNTTMFGTVISSTTGSLVLNMLSLDYYAPTYLNFTGTGSANDATAANYTVNTSAVAASPPDPTTLVKIEGFANTFGAGPPYFNATAVTPQDSLESQLIIEWNGSGSLTPFTVVNQTSIIVDLDDPALPNGAHMVRTGPTSVDLMSQPNPHLLTINYATPTATTPVLFGVGNVVIGESLFSDPQAFANEVLTVANGALPVTKLVATGQYDATSGTFTATRITINVIKQQ